MADTDIHPTLAGDVDIALRTGLFLLGRKRGAMTADDRRALEDAMGEVKTLPRRHRIVRRGEPMTHSTYLIEGHVCRYIDDREGDRQLIAIHVPGDFIDLHAFPLQRLDHDIATLGPATVGLYDHSVLERILEERPHLTRMLWFSTLLDAAMHREWIFRLGRLGAEGRVAHFMCELAERMTMIGRMQGGRFELPINQSDLAEACGLTAVHVNRTLRQLRERGLMTFRDGEVTILDPARLRTVAEFDAAYLYPENREDWAEAHARR